MPTRRWLLLTGSALLPVGLLTHRAAAQPRAWNEPEHHRDYEQWRENEWRRRQAERADWRREHWREDHERGEWMQRRRTEWERDNGRRPG
jgi:hypothetical protein